MATPKASSSTSASRSDPKRKRAASPSAGSSSAPTPSSTYFYEDGNVQLHVGSTLYKVHRSLLSQAEVFRDTLLVGGAAGESALVDGGRGADGELATIRLDDNRQDFDVFLRAMYDSLSFVRAAPTLGETRSLLRLADKYHHSAILSTAEHSFAKRVASQRAAWDAVRVDSMVASATYKVFIGLLSISEEFNISKDACVWLHEALAIQLPDSRSAMLFDQCKVEGMTVSLSRNALREVITRVDRTLDCYRMLSLSLYDNIKHSNECEQEADEADLFGTDISPCNTAQEELCRQLLSKIRPQDGLRLGQVVDSLIRLCQHDGPIFSSGHLDDVQDECLEMGILAHLATRKEKYVASLRKMLTK